MAVPSQSTEDFLYALPRCLHHLGGVPLALVSDNLKAAVVKANRYEPLINQAMEDFANHYQTTVVPARARKPRDKALVENQVKLIYSRVYAKPRNMTFFDIHSLIKAIAEKIRDRNQTRMQQKPYCREERFLAEEKKHLLPLPAQGFELKYYNELTVDSFQDETQICFERVIGFWWYSLNWVSLSFQVRNFKDCGKIAYYWKGSKNFVFVWYNKVYLQNLSQFCPAENQKNPDNNLIIKGFRTQGRSRTGTALRPLMFETNASTNSATWAYL